MVSAKCLSLPISVGTSPISSDTLEVDTGTSGILHLEQLLLSKYVGQLISNPCLIVIGVVETDFKVVVGTGF